MDEKNGKVLIYSDGVRRCASCGQRLWEGQTSCPVCKAEFTSGERVSHDDESGPYKNPEPKWGPEAKPRKRNTGVFALIVVFLLSLALVYLGNSYLSKITENNGGITPFKGLGGMSSNVPVHTEEPTARYDTPSKSGFDYQITQIFFEADENNTTRTRIEQFFFESGIAYENLHYTEGGYYTADLPDYPKTSYEENERLANELQNSFISWCQQRGSSFGLNAPIIQSWYREISP